MMIESFYINYLEVKKSKIKLIPGSGVDFAFYENTNNIQKENKVILPSRMLKDKGVTEFYEASKILKKNFLIGDLFLLELLIIKTHQQFQHKS